MDQESDLLFTNFWSNISGAIKEDSLIFEIFYLSYSKFVGIKWGNNLILDLENTTLLDSMNPWYNPLKLSSSTTFINYFIIGFADCSFNFLSFILLIYYYRVPS